MFGGGLISNCFVMTAAAASRLRRWIFCALMLMIWVPAAQSQQVFFEDFGACTSAGGPSLHNTAVALPTPIRLTLFYPSGSVSCSGWTFTGDSRLVAYASGTPFPGSATKGIWLNEANLGFIDGRMDRSFTGLTIGHTYRVSAQAWTDDVDAATAIGLDFGPVTTSLPMAAGSGPQSISADVCAKATSLNLSLYENGATNSSPIVTNVKLEDLNTPCLIAGFFTVGGSVVGLAPGNSVVLLNNGGSSLTVNANGTFTFTASAPDTSAYAATVGTQPTGQICTVTQGAGTVAGANVTNILVTCVAVVVPAVATAVPTSSTWALILTSVLLLLFALRRVTRGSRR